jgi:DNA-binding CsgD family transcriptional regulator
VLVTTLLYAKPGEVLSTVDLIPWDEFHASRFYKEWVAPQGWVDSIFATLEKSATNYAIVAFTRGDRHGIVDDATRRRLKRLAPHFRRAVSISKVIDLRAAEAASFADVLDGIAAGVILADSEANIVYANASGRTLLMQRAVVKEEGGRLSAVDLNATQMLHEVFAAANGGDAAVGLKGVAIPLTQGTDEQYVAHVLPLTSGARKSRHNYKAAAAVFIQKAGLDLPHPLETIARLYDLTAAELRVLMAIITVGPVRETAPALGVSEATVRTHLQHIYQKTGTTGQVDLVKLVAGYMSPLG